MSISSTIANPDISGEVIRVGSAFNLEVASEMDSAVKLLAVATTVTTPRIYLPISETEIV
ncbi:unannotated protein [freshwater metagenome]|uniref:Unannotated protein n=1 Tax=freshwater metagenome TaxID=449393 RepID=A0A6J7SAI8_9ZZZZ